jgi:hypothetical protein
MNPIPASLDERPITLTAWLAADLLRVLDELRYGRHGRLPDAIRQDLDYHAGLLHVRIHRAIRATGSPDKEHSS